MRDWKGAPIRCLPGKTYQRIYARNNSNSTPTLPEEMGEDTFECVRWDQSHSEVRPYEHATKQ